MKYIKQTKIIFYFSLSILAAVQFGCETKTNRNCIEKNSFDHDSTHTMLQKALTERKNQLIDYIAQINKIAQQTKDDKAMISFFKAKKEYYYLRQSTTLPSEIHQNITKLKENIQTHYLHNYLHFYDILFIDTQGEIFYTIRKQKDYHKNIFKDEFAKTTLSDKLQNNPGESFVDFQFYEISGEPSAFFIEPIFENSKPIGWFVLQCSTNKINEIFTIDEKLGSTSEVLLVNENHLLLTNSRFKVEPTVLKQELPSDNIASKFKEKKGFKNVIDYRNKEVVSAFEVFSFLNSQWLIIAKKDKDEIVTEFYSNNREKTLNEITHKILNTEYPIYDTIPYPRNTLKRVDMDEYNRTSDTTILYTQGISTCTAISAIYPGNFAYLAHISPYDKIYNESRTDITRTILKKIAYFEVTESEKEKIQFLIACTQTTALPALIKKITDEGYFLSQIKIACSPYAEYGNMYCSNDGNAYIEWIINKKSYINNYSDINSIDKLNNSALISLSD